MNRELWSRALILLRALAGLTLARLADLASGLGLHST